MKILLRLLTSIMIKIKDVKKQFGQFTAVNSISFEIKPGEVVGLLGPNGAGKTTTMRMMTGYYKPTGGSIIINDIDVENSPVEVKKSIGYLPENAALYNDMVVADYLDFMGRSRELSGENLSRGIEYSVTATGIEKYFYRPISHLSKGYKQRVGIASTLLHNPKILILDEPTSGLDPNQITEIQNLIKKLSVDKTIILSTHILSEVENTCQRAIIISNGNIVLDKPLSEIGVQENKYKIYTKIRGYMEGAGKILASAMNLPEKSVRILNKNNDFTLIEIESDFQNGEIVFQTAVQNNWSLIELYTKKESLTDIFQSLTGGKHD